MSDYKVIPSTDPKKPGYAVQTPDKVIANGAVLTKKEAQHLCDTLNAYTQAWKRQGISPTNGP